MLVTTTNLLLIAALICAILLDESGGILVVMYWLLTMLSSIPYWLLPDADLHGPVGRVAEPDRKHVYLRSYRQRNPHDVRLLERFADTRNALPALGESQPLGFHSRQAQGASTRGFVRANSWRSVMITNML